MFSQEPSEIVNETAISPIDPETRRKEIDMLLAGIEEYLGYIKKNVEDRGKNRTLDRLLNFEYDNN